MKTYQEFWPFYLKEHSHPLNRRLHFVGTSLVVLMAIVGILAGKLSLLFVCPVVGYGFAWFGHFIVEKNRPATFKHPLWSLRGDFHLWWYMLSRKKEATWVG